MESYTYERQLKYDEVRLLEFQSLQDQGTLRATTQYHQLNDCPPYYALSYPWGNAFNDEHRSSRYQDSSRRFDFVLDNKRFKIFDSLNSALQGARSARRQDTRLLIWADAVCINQDDEEEKVSQIRMMRNIYERATGVLVWLGPSDMNSDLAMKCLASGYRYYQKTAHLMQLGECRAAVPPPANEEELQDQLMAGSLGKLFGLEVKSNVAMPEYPIEAVADLLNRAYWGRGWCWQEFTVSTKMITLCGDAFWEDGDMCVQIFLETWDRLKLETGYQPYLLDHRPWAMQELRRNHQNMKHLREAGFVDDPSIETPVDWMPLKIYAKMNPDMTDMGKAWMHREAINKLSVRSLLEESSISWLQATKQHDQIYAFLGIASDAEELDIKVDYALPWEQVYTQLMITYLSKSELWFLNYCQNSTSSRSRQLPSWVPDWSKGLDGCLIGNHYSPSTDHVGTTQPFIVPDVDELRKHSRLCLKGMITDEVLWVSKPRFVMSVNQLRTPLRTSLYQWILEVAKHCSKHSRRDLWTVLIANSSDLPLPNDYKTGLSVEGQRSLLDRAFDSILALDEISDNAYELFKKFPQSMRMSFAGIQAIRTKPVIEAFLRCFMQATTEKCVFQTREGRLGLATKGLKRGDRIAVFMGNNAPFIIRHVPLTFRPARYRIMSESYVHGLMDDERIKATAKVEDIILE